MVELGEHGVATPAIEDSIHFSVVHLQANRAISSRGQLFSLTLKIRFVNFVNDPYLQSNLITDRRLIKCLHEMVEK